MRGNGLACAWPLCAAAPPGPLFGDQGPLGLLVEELWPGAMPASPSPLVPSHAGTPGSTQQLPRECADPGRGEAGWQQQLQRPQAGQVGDAGVEQGGAAAADSDDDSDYEAFDVTEDAADDAWHAADPQ